MPAGMYLEELPRDIEAEREFAKRYEYLHALDLFGLDAVLHGIGYFKFDKNKIYVGAKEKKSSFVIVPLIRSFSRQSNLQSMK